MRVITFCAVALVLVGSATGRVLQQTISSNITTIRAALEEAGLTKIGTLLDYNYNDIGYVQDDPTANITLLAPTNEAIDTALASLGLTEAQLLNNTDLALLILAQHVIEGTHLSSEFVDMPTYETMDGNVTLTTRTVTTPYNQTVALGGKDFVAGSSVVHAINGVLLPSQAALASVLPGMNTTVVDPMPVPGNDTTNETALALPAAAGANVTEGDLVEPLPDEAPVEPLPVEAPTEAAVEPAPANETSPAAPAAAPAPAKSGLPALQLSTALAVLPTVALLALLA